MQQQRIGIHSSEAEEFISTKVANFYGSAVWFIVAVDRKGKNVPCLKLLGRRRQISGSKMLVGNPDFELRVTVFDALVEKNSKNSHLKDAYRRIPAFQRRLFLNRSTTHEIYNIFSA